MNQPAHEIKFGSAKATIWLNDTRFGSKYSVTVVRLYKANGEWRESQSFGRDEALLAAKALNQANTWIHTQGPPLQADSSRQSTIGGPQS